MTEEQPDLLTRFREGDPSAFSSLVAEMGPRLKGFFLRQGAQASTAEDLTQHVFLRVYQSSDRYQASGRLAAYLLRIARNLWIDYCRKKRPFSLGESFPDAADSGPGPVELGEAGDRAALLRKALASMDSATQEIIEMAVLQQLPYQDVAAVLHIPVGTVKSRVYYALRKLREVLEHPLRDSTPES